MPGAVCRRGWLDILRIVGMHGRQNPRVRRLASIVLEIELPIALFKALQAWVLDTSFRGPFGMEG